MKEKDIREHINAFLRSKLQHLVVPASMGFGLMLGGRPVMAGAPDRGAVPHPLPRARDLRRPQHRPFGKPESALRAADAALPFWLGCRAGCQVIGIESGGDV